MVTLVVPPGLRGHSNAARICLPARSPFPSGVHLHAELERSAGRRVTLCAEELLGVVVKGIHQLDAQLIEGSQAMPAAGSAVSLVAAAPPAWRVRPSVPVPRPARTGGR